MHLIYKDLLYLKTEDRP